MTPRARCLAAAATVAMLLASPPSSAHEALLTLDTHVDIPDDYMRDPRFDAGTDTDLRVDLGKMAAGGLDAAFFVVYTEQGPLTPEGYATARATAERKYSAIEALVRRYPDRIRLATTPAQVRANHDAGVASALIGIENGYSLGEDVDAVDAAFRRGARYLGLTHTGHNAICTSSGAREDLGDAPAGDRGLSAFGRDVVRRANALGMLVDVSHASDACVRDVLALSSAPIIASHSSARALVDHPRNLPDALLRAIAARGGVVHAVAYREFVKHDPARAAAEADLQARVAASAGADEYDSVLHGSLPMAVEGMRAIEARHPMATVEDYVDHVEHMVGVMGIDHVGLASDFDGGGQVTGWSNAAETANVTAALRARGFDEADIAKLWGGNLLRTWAQAEAVARDDATPAGVPDAAPSAPDLAAMDAAIHDAFQRYSLPGLAAGVIVDGEVALVRTLGETVAGSGDPVTRDTLFKIASNSKAMTATVLARLVQQGRLRWDDPVVRHLPHFAMHDPWVTAHMTVRDLLVHNSGLPEGGGDLMLWPEPNRFSREDITRGLRHIVPAYGFRAGYAYDNLLYVVAGEVAAAAGGAPYEALVEREIFGPLGLDGCRVGRFDRDGVSVAQPHWNDGGRNVPYRRDPPVVDAIASAAAGGIRCTLGDMLAWARNWLAPTPAQLEWLSPAQREAIVTPVTVMPLSQRRRDWNDNHVYAYALGFRVADADGAWTVSHTGTLGGMYSVMTLLPDLRSGYVVMMNGEGSQARTVLDQVLLKHFTAPDERPTVAGYAARLDAEPAPVDAGPVPDTSARRPATSAEAAPWLGTWRDPWLGDAALCEADGRVQFRVAKSPLLAGDLVRVGDRFLVDWHDDGVGVEPWMDFTAHPDGRRTLAMAKLDPRADFSSDFEDLAFERTGDCPVLVDVASLVPDIDLDIRYAGPDNFTGAPVPGYDAPKCLLRREAAEALASVDRALRADGRRLRVFDCYRPVRAVERFVAWAGEPDDPATRAAWHPALAREDLLGGYIAAHSGHSRGATVDLTLLDCTGASGCAPLDMGTAFDVFDPSANTDAPGLGAAQRANRAALVQAMAAAGFANYPMEWWHFTLQPEPVPAVAFDVPVR